MGSENHEQAMPPEQVARCLVALQGHGYSVEERRYGWLVVEPAGGRQRIESVEQLVEYTARFVKVENQSPPEDETYEAAADEHSVEDESSDGTSNMAYGAVSLAIGVIVTLVTYGAAADGGTYVIAYGAMGTGAVLLIGGLFQRLKHQKGGRTM